MNEQVSARPSVSVVIPTKNRAKIIPETIDSVLAQTYRDFELVISNNHSDDETDAVLSTYARRDSRVKIVQPPSPLNITEHWNWVWRQASCEYVAFLSDDDCWRPSFLKAVVDVARENPELDIIATNYSYWRTGDEDIIEERSSVPNNVVGVVPDPLTAMLRHNLIFMNCALVRNTVHQELGGYGQTYAGDFELWIKAAIAKKKFYYLPESHLNYRIHGSQNTNRVLMTRLSAEVLERHMDSSPEWHVRLRMRRAASGTYALVGRNALQSEVLDPGESPGTYFRRGLAIFPAHPGNWLGLLKTLRK